MAAMLHGDGQRWVMRSWGILCGLCSLTLCIGLTTWHIRTLYLVTLLWGLVLGMWALLRLLVQRPRSRVPVAAAVLLLTFWFTVGNRPVDPAQLRATYRRVLVSFTGTPYVWGGESHLGVDCSGLARTALWEAMLLDGVRTGNPRLLGPALWRFWWHDVGAEAMGRGADGYTEVTGHAPKLASADVSELEIGDLAIGGGHVLIYVGDRRWIEANPGDHRVVVHEATLRSPRGYFNVPITYARWRILEGSPGLRDPQSR